MITTSAIQDSQEATQGEEPLQPYGGGDQGSFKRDVSLGSLALIDQLVVSATNFATTLLFSNLCSVPEMGLFGLAWTIFGFQRTAQERMLSAPYVVFAHRKGQDNESWLGSSLVHQAVFAGICALLSWALGVVFLGTDKLADMVPVMVALGLMTPVLLLRDHVRAVSAAHFRYDVSLVLDVCISVLQIGGILLLWSFNLLTIPSGILIIGLACLLPIAAWMIRQPQPRRFERQQVHADWKTSWEYSQWLVAARTIGISGFYLIPWILAYMMDEAAVGAFTVCSNLVGLSMMFIIGINNFFMPRTIAAFQTQGKTGVIKSLTETVVVFGTVLGGVSLLLFFAGDALLGFYGKQYVGLGRVVFYLSLSMITVCLSIAWGNGLAALGKPRGYFWGELSYFMVAVSLAVVLIPKYELTGAAIALICAGLSVSLVTGVVLWRLLADIDPAQIGTESGESA